MTMLRGKFTCPREIVPRKIVVGDSPIVQCECGCERWYDKRTGKEVEVKSGTFEELLKDAGGCQIKPIEEGE